MIDQFIIPLLKILIVLNATLVGVTYMVLLERKVIAWAQSRLGPMRVGPYGILQPVADAVKLMIKEDITPVRADRWVFTAAPIISMVPALIVYAVIPFGPVVKILGHPVSLYITDINVGLLYIVSVASVGVYGIILAGYASNSKFPLLASLRASAIGCSTPDGPTRIGPSRDCTHAMTLRSSSVMYETAISVAFRTTRILISGMTSCSITARLLQARCRLSQSAPRHRPRGVRARAAAAPAGCRTTADGRGSGTGWSISRR